MNNHKTVKIKDLKTGDKVRAANGIAHITKCQRARWIQIADGVAYDVEYKIKGQKSWCIQAGNDLLELHDK